MKANDSSTANGLPPRDVVIERHGSTWAVAYCQRKHGGRHWAASFYAPDHSLNQVETWVRNNRKLKLVNPQT